MFQMVSLGTILEHFGPKAAQMLQMVSLDIILTIISEPMPPRRSKQLVLYHFEPFWAQGRPDASTYVPNNKFAAILNHLFSDSCL